LRRNKNGHQKLLQSPASSSVSPSPAEPTPNPHAREPGDKHPHRPSGSCRTETLGARPSPCEPAAPAPAVPGDVVPGARFPPPGPQAREHSPPSPPGPRGSSHAGPALAPSHDRPLPVPAPLGVSPTPPAPPSSSGPQLRRQAGGPPVPPSHRD
jgi:hypothetical protein